jgi:hypothetical protein
VNRLGERIRRRSQRDGDVEALSRFREGFESATLAVAERVGRILFCKSTVALRPSKSTISIVAKLSRERSRLSQMQDIGGMRIIVSRVSQQDRLVTALQELFVGARVIDRRADPRAGYRGVHVVVSCDGYLIEIQVRTRLQNAWAQFSEKLADEYGEPVKYGGGPEIARSWLDAASQWVAGVEAFEIELDRFKLGTINALYRKQKSGTLTDDEQVILRGYQAQQLQKRRARLSGFRNLEGGARR